MEILELLRLAGEAGASDLHLTVDLPPVQRLNGELVTLALPPLTAREIAQALETMLPDEAQGRKVQETGDLDFAFGVGGLGRFRVNAFRQRGSLSLAIRVIPHQVPSLSQLGVPEIVPALALSGRGLVLVTGPTGSGKSTTLAAMVEEINQRRSCHVVTLEDPVEYLHKHGLSVIHQREIGIDSLSFAGALRAALRQDPDVILLGEMRDYETISTAITAAETGHLVLATLHTADAAGTVDRLIDAFPPHQQGQTRGQLAAVLQGVIAQRLLARRDGRGRVAALEVLVGTPAVRNLIREGKTHQLPSAIQTGAKYGMRTMEQSLQDLVAQGIIGEAETVPQRPVY